MLDAIVIGSGPNGLAAAIALARAGRSVRVYEAQSTIGGATRSLPLTEPGFVHDVCATVHALVAASPFLSSLPLADFGYELVHAPAPFAHPLDDGTAVVAHRSVEATADSLRRDDAAAYRRLMTPFVERSADLMEALLGPIRLRHPFLMARFGLIAIRSADALARARFKDERTRAMFAGAAAHSVAPLEFRGTAGFAMGLVVAAHAVGWPVAKGGSQTLPDALAAYLRSLGGEIVVDSPIETLAQLPPSRAVLCDVTPRQFVRMAADRIPARYRRQSRTAIATGRACSRWIGRSMRRCRGGRRNAGAPGRSISGARSRRSPTRSAPRGKAGSMTSLTSCWCNRPSAIHRARPRASTRSGRTATSRTAARST